MTTCCQYSSTVECLTALIADYSWCATAVRILHQVQYSKKQGVRGNTGSDRKVIKESPYSLFNIVFGELER